MGTFNIPQGTDPGQAFASDPQTRKRLVQMVMGSDPSAAMDPPQNDRIADDLTRHPAGFEPEPGSTEDLESRASSGRQSLLDNIRQNPAQPSRLDQLRTQYDEMKPPEAPAPRKWWQNILVGLGGVGAVNADNARRAQQQQFEEGRYDRGRQSLLSQIDAERRIQEENELAEQRDVSAYQRQLQMQREQDLRTAPKTLDTDQGPMQWDMQSRQWSPIMRNGQPVGPKAQPKPDSEFQQFANAPENRGKSPTQIVKDYAAATQKPQVQPQQLAIAPSGQVMAMRPGMTVPQGTVTASQYGPEQTKLQQQGQTAQATYNSFDRYRNSFRTFAPQLSEDDRRAMQVLVSHEQVAHGFLDKAASGVLDTLFGEPLTGYSEKAMSGIMTKDQYDRMSSGGKKMLTDYFNAVIQNFGQMKQMMGSVGRNPMQLQAEINTIPLPYVDPQAAEMMFSDKFEDLNTRNRNLPGFGQQQRGNSPEQLIPPRSARPNMKWQHRTTNGKTEWREVPEQ